MSYAPDDSDTPEQERARITHVRVEVAALKVAALDRQVLLNHRDRPQVRNFMRLDFARITADDLHAIDCLCWAWRRSPGFPRHLAPEMNPADPIVKAFAA